MRPTRFATTDTHLVSSGGQVICDMIYDGNPESELGDIVRRVAQSFTRSGNFEIFATRDEKVRLNQPINFTFIRDFSDLVPDLSLNSKTKLG